MKRTLENETFSIDEVRALIPESLKGKVEITWYNKKGDREPSLDKRQKFDSYVKSRKINNTEFEGGIGIVFKEDVSGEFDIVKKMLEDLIEARHIIQGIHLDNYICNNTIIRFLDQRLAIEDFSFTYDSEIDADLKLFLDIHQGSITALKISQNEPGFEMSSDGTRSRLMESVIRCSNLRKLTFYGCQDGDNDPSVFDCGIFQYLPHLEELHLPDYQDLSDQDISEMIQSLNPALKTIELWKGWEIQNGQCFENFFNQYKHLQNITLENFISENLDPILGRSLETMVRNNPNLVNLNIQESTLTDENLIRLLDSLAVNCESLQSLNINLCRSEATEGSYEDDDFDRRIKAGVEKLFKQCRFLTKIILPDGRDLESREAITKFICPELSPSVSSHSSLEDLDQELGREDDGSR